MERFGRHVRRVTKVSLVFLLVTVVIVGGLLANQLVGPAHTAREQAIAALRQQVALLPPFQGRQAVQTIVYDQPFRDPSIQSEYWLPDQVTLPFPSVSSEQCAVLQSYYATQTAEHGWRTKISEQMTDHYSNGGTWHELKSVFEKNVRVHSFELDVDCRWDALGGAGYTVSMTAH
jgi:hypothetical protein